ncbi:MAG: response regulator transcription factor [Bacteroidia bacterium]|nr:response regulator transcription factor [Bacteroidia bacterium]MBT8287942.1 response regulator transcription factor [Bacteroidia bacterium]NNK86993.1 response regulator transcription factor [Flavobacteriaceae bacterium]
MKKILIADDHAILRKGIIQLLKEDLEDYQFVEASNGIEVISLVRKDKFELILLDISMPELNGIDALKQIRAMRFETPVIMLTVQAEDQYAIRVLKAGAQGFLNKDTAPEELLTAIKKVLSGKKYITETVSDLLINNIRLKKEGKEIDLLSDREIQVMQHMAEGQSISEIAKNIGLSINTISTYRSRIMNKLSLKNNAAIIRYAIDNNII